MRIEIFSPNLNLIYENSILFIDFFYRGFINLAAHLNI